MEILYWSQVLGNIGVALSIVGSMLLVAFIVMFFMIHLSYEEPYSSYEEASLKHFKHVRKVLGWVSIPMFVLGMFIPTTEQFYVIYGVGSIIDSVKDKEIVKQLPEKYIELLDAWAEKHLNNE